jgi:hypothetical protein
MVKVIKIDKKQAKRITHQECGAVLEYFQNEVKSRMVSDYGGGRDAYYYIICPHCNKEVGWGG